MERQKDPAVFRGPLKGLTSNLHAVVKVAVAAAARPAAPLVFLVELVAVVHLVFFVHKGHPRGVRVADQVIGAEQCHGHVRPIQAQKDIYPKCHIVDIFIFHHVHCMAVAVHGPDHGTRVQAPMSRIQDKMPAL